MPDVPLFYRDLLNDALQVARSLFLLFLTEVTLSYRDHQLFEPNLQGSSLVLRMNATAKPGRNVRKQQERNIGSTI